MTVFEGVGVCCFGARVREFGIGSIGLGDRDWEFGIGTMSKVLRGSKAWKFKL